VPTATDRPPGVPPDDITAHLVAVRDGGRAAIDALFPLVYDRLHQLARARAAGAPIDATELVHEAYLRFVDASRATYNDRQHFFAVAARAMRQIVVDHVRRQGAAKRGAGFRLTTLGDKAAAGEAAVDTVLAVHEALEALAAASPRLVQVVEACYFLGLTTDEAGETLGLSARTVKREWQKAKLLLGALLAGAPDAR
jgi:RNA polymerase sigma factor (TIGR02999 family)